MNEICGLNHKQIDAFRNIIKKLYGIELSREAAAEKARALIELYKLVYMKKMST